MRVSHQRAALSLSVAFVLLGAQFAESAHLEASHYICPEHGEVIHQGPTGPIAAQADDQVQGRDSVDEHELHCAQAVASAAVPVQQRADRQPTPITADIGGGPYASRIPIALLSLAPKGSPPVV